MAAENFWGSIASQLGGSRVHVTSVITSPATDPHDYEPTAADARTLAGARMVIVNGIGWQSLRAHLLPRRREAVMPGVRRTFPGARLRPADLVTCDILGHELEDGVPIDFGTSSEGYGGKNVTSVTLSVTHNRDDSVTASCHRGEA